MLITKSVKKGTELPYRIEIGSLCGAAITPARAVIAALRVGKEIPSEVRNPEEAVIYLLQGPRAQDWKEVIDILVENSFEGVIE